MSHVGTRPQAAANPLIADWNLRYGAIPFDQVKTEHFLPALEHAIEAADARIEEIASNPDTPTFANSLVPLEELGRGIERVETVYSNLFAAHGDDTLRSLAGDFYSQLSDFWNRVSTHERIFDRVRQVYEARESLGLDADDRRLLELKYRDLVRNGANLDPSGKEQLGAIDREFSTLTAEFARDGAKDLNAFVYHTQDDADIRGLATDVVERAATEARDRGHDSGWCFTLLQPSALPVRRSCESRRLRETLHRAAARIGLGGQFDNVPRAKRIATLRHERARLLGYASHADYVLERRMAGKPATVTTFLDRYKEVALPAARANLEEMREFALARDGVENLSQWDVTFYLEKLKKDRLDFDPETLRPYFEKDRVVAGIIEIARRLYGVEFRRVNDLPTYHPDVEVYEVQQTNGELLGLMYLDLIARTTKQQGAWQSLLRIDGDFEGEHLRPVTMVVANLTPSTRDNPALLALHEVTTIFHEMGHALHMLQSQARYPALSSSEVFWDFVELPSQLMENWILEPDALALFAKHHETGALIPPDLVDKVREARRFHGGLILSRSLALELIDWAWHSGDPSSIDDVIEFERDVTKDVALFPALEDSAASPGFDHIFAGGYAAGFYSYRWAEALEADAFEHFQEKGIFNTEVAHSFRDNVLAQGNREHPALLYERFRGRAPDPDALLRKFGLL